MLLMINVVLLFNIVVNVTKLTSDSCGLKFALRYVSFNQDKTNTSQLIEPIYLQYLYKASTT